MPLLLAWKGTGCFKTEDPRRVLGNKPEVLFKIHFPAAMKEWLGVLQPLLPPKGPYN